MKVTMTVSCYHNYSKNSLTSLKFCSIIAKTTRQCHALFRGYQLLSQLLLLRLQLGHSIVNVFRYSLPFV